MNRAEVNGVIDVMGDPYPPIDALVVGVYRTPNQRFELVHVQGYFPGRGRVIEGWTGTETEVFRKSKINTQQGPHNGEIAYEVVTFRSPKIYDQMRSIFDRSWAKAVERQRCVPIAA